MAATSVLSAADYYVGTIGDDVSSQVADPSFITAVPSISSDKSEFKLSSASLAINAVEPSASFTPDLDEKDFFGASRLASGQVDVGCHEYMTDLQIWRDTYFDAP